MLDRQRGDSTYKVHRPWEHYDAADARFGHGHKGDFKPIGASGFNGMERHAAPLGSFLGCFPVGMIPWKGRVPKDGDADDFWGDLLEKVDVLAERLWRYVVGQASDVPSRSSQTANEAGAHRVVGEHDNWDRG